MGGSKVRENSSANITRFGGWSREGRGVHGEDIEHNLRDDEHSRGPFRFVTDLGRNPGRKIEGEAKGATLILNFET